MPAFFRFVTTNADTVDDQKVYDPFYIQFKGPAKCEQNKLALESSAVLDHAYTVAFTVDASAPEDIFGHAITQTDARCAPTQKLEVLVDQEWLEFNSENAERIPFVTSFEESQTQPNFRFQMDKDAYAAMFTGAASGEIRARIVSTDEQSAHALRTVTDEFAIEVSLGCMDDRIVPPPAIPMARMMMQADANGVTTANPVVIDMSGYESEQPDCRAYAGITVERLTFDDEPTQPADTWVDAVADASRLAYLQVDTEAETLTVLDPSFDHVEGQHEYFVSIRVTYRTGAQAAGIDTREPESQIYQIRFVKAGYENCRDNVLKVEDSTLASAPIIRYVLGSGDMPVAPGFINTVGATLCPTTFTLEVQDGNDYVAYTGADIKDIATDVPSFTINSDDADGVLRPRTMKVFKLTATDGWSTALSFYMEIFFEDACADAKFRHKTAQADLEVIFGESGKLVEPAFEVSDSACLPTMTVTTSVTGASNYDTPEVTETEDYIASVADRSLTLASSVAGQLEKTIYFRLSYTIAGSLYASTEGVDGGMLTYEFAVTYLHQCARNGLTRVGDTIVYKYFIEEAATHDYTPNVVNSVAGCAHTAELQFEINGSYETYVADPKSHAFVNSFDETTGLLVVDASTFDGFQGSSADVSARITVTDPNSAKTDGTNAVVDNFVVTLTNPCSAATVAFDAALTDVALTVQGTGDEIRRVVPFSAAVVDSALAYCQIEYSL
jgi:hypothetical protein